MGSHGKWTPLGDGSLTTEDPDVGLGHIAPLKVYNLVFTSLLVLTVVTVWVAMYDFGPFNIFVALGIATVKAALVTLYFMHLTYESKIFWGIVAYPILIFVLILAGTLGDATIIIHPEPINPIETPAE